uniref:Uncharacterized protein n=1 Tax=Maylandia zebra TaxID=106582 RepID=A0A3P9DHV6_9CICH
MINGSCSEIGPVPDVPFEEPFPEPEASMKSEDRQIKKKKKGFFKRLRSLFCCCWFLCALIYPILKELRAERVTGEDGTEEKMLGFWSLLVLSVLVGCICCVFSWMLTYLDSFQPGMDFPTQWPTSETFNIDYICLNC